MIYCYECGVVITSATMSLGELASMIGRPPQAGSHDKDERHRSGSTWGQTIWREDAQDLTGSLPSQVLQLVRDVGPKCVDAVNNGGGDFQAALNVVLFFDTYTVELSLPHELIEAMALHKLALSFSAYPTSERD